MFYLGRNHTATKRIVLHRNRYKIVAETKDRQYRVGQPVRLLVFNPFKFNCAPLTSLFNCYLDFCKEF